LLGFFDSLSIKPFFEFNGEYKLSDKFGVGGFVGLGANNRKWFTYEIGPQFSAFPVGTFRSGMRVAAEILLLSEAGRDTTVASSPTISRKTLSFGATVGYKYEARNGITLVTEVGVRARTSRASVTGLDSASSVGTRSYFDPTLRFLLGYSF
jgi:hypothetical protein